MRNIKDLFQEKGKQQTTLTRNTVDDKSVLFLFRKIFGELYGVKGQENIIPVQIQNKKLFLKPRTSLWANEVLLEKDMLIKKLNEALEQEYIEDIIITQKSEESFKS